VKTGSRVFRRDAAVSLAALAAVAAGLVAYSPAPVGVFWDDAVYVITAKALALGEGYRYIHLPGTPAATHYPPLWPAVLSVVWRISPEFPENVRLMKLLNPAFLGLAAIAATILARRVARVRPWVAALTVAASIAVAPMLLLSAVLMSEPFCLALSAAALASATTMVMRGRVRDAMWAGALAGLAILSRSAAVVLIPGLATGLLWRRSRKASAIALAVCAVIIAPWFVWSGAHAAELQAPLAGSYGPYAGWLLEAYIADPGLLVEVVRQNLASMLNDSAVVLFGGLPPGTRRYLAVPLFVMTAVGLVLAGRRAAALSVTLLAYTVLIVIWPYPPGRFMWAFFPLYAVGGIAATLALVRRLRPARGRASATRRAVALAPAAFAVLTLGMLLRYDVRTVQRGWYRTAIERNAEGVVGTVGWIANNTAPTDTIATDVHLLAYLYADRIAVPVNSLTVSEHVRPKSVAMMRAEFAAIDSAFRPRWWVTTGMVPERFALLAWVNDSSGTVRAVAPMPNGGLAARVTAR
jgi:hypothetical protein